MNATLQSIANIKNEYAQKFISQSLSLSLPSSSSRLRLNDARMILNEKTKPFEVKLFKVRNVSFDMICCPKGVFTMGADDQNNNPKRSESILQPFLLGETEVTQELYQAVIRYNPSEFKTNGAKKPVENVNWYEAVVFCNKLSAMLGKMPYYHISNITFDSQNKAMIESTIVQINRNANGFRLPTEKEWEYAAKAGTNNEYAGCDNETDLECYGWYEENSGGSTIPVKNRLPNEWGFYDMSGNVWEWCWDKYDNTLANRVSRGGSWISEDASRLSSAARNSSSPGDRYDNIGFRIASSIVK
jgi:sulfatase modifying factor 1